jgi:hypothetical protein
MKTIKILTLFVLTIIMTGCSNTETVTHTLNNIQVSGEFLFEGPNTLQGAITTGIDDLANNVNSSAKDLKRVRVDSVVVNIPGDSLRSNLESLLVQIVSDELPLISLGTINPLTAGSIQSLNTNKEAELLPYFQSESAILVVDANFQKDMDFAELSVDLFLSIESTK